jgi:hypothetical protein
LHLAHFRSALLFLVQTALHVSVMPPAHPESAKTSFLTPFLNEVALLDVFQSLE